MSRPLDRLLRAALKLPIILLLTLGIGLPPLYHVGLGFLAGRFILIAGGISCALSLLQIKKRLLSFSVGAFFILQAILLPFGKGVFPQTIETFRLLQLWLSGAEVAIPLFADLFCTQFAIYLPLLCCLIASMEDELYPPVFCVAVILTLEWLLGIRGQSRYMLMVLPALMLHYGITHLHEADSSENRKIRLSPMMLPVLALLLALSSLLAPPEGTVNQTLSHAAQEIRDAINDHFFFDEERARYTLASDGWMPQGERQLGGAATPSEQLVMVVETSEVAYLRGAILDTYTGAAWYDAISAKRYHWQAPQYRPLRDELMQTAYPLSSGQSEKTLRITMQTGSASSLFTPQRIRELSLGADMIAYFNAGSEVFITRNLQANDTYSVSYLPMKATDSGMAALVAQNAHAEDPYYEQAQSLYTALPSHIQQEIYDLAHQVTSGLSSSWEKAVALRDYLKTHYTYDLQVETPPRDVDFVAWFLLAEQKGYCTYFASAMTVLCRIAGLPARYVEGYVARPDGNGLAYVYGTNAHAWTEVYLNGVGWVTFDATASSYNEPDRSNEGFSGDMPEQNNTPSPSPHPSAAPSPSPSPNQANTPTPNPSEPPSENNPDTPSPKPSTQPPSGNDDSSDSANAPSLPWLWLLLLLLLVMWLAWRIHTTDPLRTADRAATDSAALLVLWEAILSCSARLGFRREASETPLHFAMRAQSGLGIKLYILAEVISAVHYGRHTPPSEILSIARDSYQSLHEQLNMLQKLRLSLRRALHITWPKLRGRKR